jgi:hypothetical protein
MAMTKNVSHQEIRLHTRKMRETREGDRVESEMEFHMVQRTAINGRRTNQVGRWQKFLIFFEVLKGLALAVIGIAKGGGS